MAKIFFISPIGKKSFLLFDTFEKTFLEEGHEIVEDSELADVCFFDLYSGLGEYVQEDLIIVIKRKIPVVFFDFFDWGGMSKENWFGFKVDAHMKEQWCNFYWEAYEKCKIVYFMRKMDKTIKFPPYIYPLELILYPTHDFPLLTKEQLYNRWNDICFIGNISPQRSHVYDGLIKNFTCDFVLGQERIPNNEWVDRHRSARFFLTADGGGFGDERPYQLITSSVMLKQRNNQLILNDFQDGIDCMMVDEHPSPNDIERLKTVLNNQDALYQIYYRGVERMRKYFNAEYRSKYILSTLKQEEII